MKRTILTEYDDRDLELLRITLPDNPCDKCSLRSGGGCCGCNENTQYMNNTKEYRDRDIYGVALCLKRYSDLHDKIKKMREEMCEIVYELYNKESLHVEVDMNTDMEITNITRRE